MGITQPNPFLGMSLKRNPTAEEAWLLGFLWADAHLSKEGGLHLEIKASDGREITKTVMKTGAWCYSERTRKTRSRGPTSLFHKHSKLFRDFLADHDFYRRETGAAKILKALPENLRPHWIRGFFDGDGCVITNYEARSFNIVFAGPYHQSWRFLQDFLDLSGLRWRVDRKKTVTGNSSTLKILGGREAVATFGELIYGEYGNYDGIGLHRKFTKFKKLAEFPNILGDLRAVKYIAVNLKSGRARIFLSRKEVVDSGFDMHTVRRCVRGAAENYSGFAWSVAT